MATLRTRWLLAILLVNLPNCCVATDASGTSAPPAHLECYFPCNEEICCVNIHCHWSALDAQIPRNYSLHWDPAISKGYVTSQTGSSGIIYREDFANNGELHVWVKSTSQHGSVISHDDVFSIADIIKPPPPNVMPLCQQRSIEIEWISFCDKLGFSLGNCDFRYRFNYQVWLEHESGFYHMHTIESPQPCTVFEVQVRCACEIGLMSDWSPIQNLTCAETNPIGKPDIWWDCGTSPVSFNCALTWKNLAMSQPCSVLGYEVKLFYNNNTTVPPHKLSVPLCNEMRCHLNTSLKDVTSFNVSAYNNHGATEPSQLIMPIPGKEKEKKDEQAIQLKMNEVNLTVSWDLPSQHTDNLKGYVVQYKQAGCPPGKGFDWIKVMKNQTTVFFKGQFKKETAFLVSLFSVSRSLEIHHLSSAIGYSHEGIPFAVQSFKVFSIADTQVTLFWEPVLLSKQKGVIQYYQIGVDTQHVYNVSASPQHENGTFQLKHLSPGQEYAVWIRAVTGAGPGANATITFKTTQHKIYVHLIPVILVPIFVLVIISSTFLLCPCHGENKVVTLWFCEKVPDPRNSHIFRQMQHQLNDSLILTYITVNETHPNISILEIVEIQPGEFMSSLEKTSNPDGLTKSVEDGRSHLDCQDDQREDVVTKQGGRAGPRYERKEYSKMVDSDEERDRKEDEDDCWNSSEDDHLTSGYEKHFMPTALEILKV